MEAFEQLIEQIAPNLYAYRDRFFTSFAATFEMFAKAGIIAFVVGLFFGVLLVITRKGGVRQNLVVYQIVNIVINVFRSIPFIILLVAIIPFTRLVVGTSLGVPGAVVPLVVAAAPFVGRMVEQSLAEVDAGLVEAAQSFGASTWQIVAKVFLWESLPSLIRGFSIVLITLLGYSAMAGTVGAGGLGDIAIRYGYQRYMVDVMIATIVILIVLVQIVQSGCDLAARKIDRKK